jgi:RNA polymerase sigma factor (sigma-70 family)
MAETTLSKLLADRHRFLWFLEARVHDRAIAEDILQSAYLRALQHEGELRDRESVSGWFYRVLRNAVIDQYRRRSSEEKALAEWGRELERTPESSHALEQEICGCLAGVIAAMPPGYARLLEKVELGGVGLKEFASAENISPVNAAVRAHRARAALRKRLIQTCGSCSAHGCTECTCRQSGP